MVGVVVDERAQIAGWKRVAVRNFRFGLPTSTQLAMTSQLTSLDVFIDLDAIFVCE